MLWDLGGVDDGAWEVIMVSEKEARFECVVTSTVNHLKHLVSLIEEATLRAAVADVRGGDNSRAPRDLEREHGRLPSRERWTTS